MASGFRTSVLFCASFALVLVQISLIGVLSFISAGKRSREESPNAPEVGKTEPLRGQLFPAEPNKTSKKLIGLSVSPVKVLSDFDLKKSPTTTSVIASATLAMVPSEALLQNERELKRERIKQSNREFSRRFKILILYAEAGELSLKIEAFTSENLTLKSEINRLTDNSQKLKFQNVKLRLKDTLEICKFYINSLNVDDNEIQAMPWSVVLEKVVKFQESQQLCVVKDLSAHDIIMRMMRKENYMIGMLNKGVCLSDLLVGPRYVIFHFGELAAIAHIPILPLRHAERFYNHPSTASSRRWSNLSRWVLREYNEVHPLFRHRCPGCSVPWSNERPLESKELNAIIGTWFTLWRD
ncbi:common plant regulatory factor 1-like protein isoform X1 [Tanacetum coccineum]|uniref:Autophagy-related protein 9 n=1 Tax=Tanacetum coccineum TaxID=301880 RepID=A0ABQ5C5X1_9ASTR